MQPINRLYGASEVRELDRLAMETLGVDAYTLMQRAAAAAWRVLRDRWPAVGRIVVCAGGGNNGGDGYELACLARSAGIRVQLVGVGGRPIRGPAAKAYEAWQTSGGNLEDPGDIDVLLNEADVVVDAIYGTGLSRPPGDVAKSAITAINAARDRGRGILAVDVPSGLLTDTGATPGVAVHADVTVTFVGNKVGLYTAQGPDYSGQIEFESLGAPISAYERVLPRARRLSYDDLRTTFRSRKRSAHKGLQGHVLLVGGNQGMAGAVLLAARGALRAGAGLVSIATRSRHVSQLAAAQPEAMVHGVETFEQILPVLERATVVGIGPGLGRDEWAQMLWHNLASFPRLVADADALNFLAESPLKHDNWVLTPHPGEAARLLKTTVASVQEDRLNAVRELAVRYGGFPLLKGAGSVLWDGLDVMLCPFGNPGMAVGGMGDVLTGVIAAAIAQGLTPPQAGTAGMLMHAFAGDLAAVEGERGMLPSDLIDQLRQAANP